MTTIDARGEICPIPLIKAKEAIKNLNGAGDVEVLVDNEIAVQNLEKMAGQMEYGVESSKEEEKTWKVVLHEMLDKRLWAVVDTLSIPYIKEAYTHAENFMITAAGQRNRNHVGAFVDFKRVPFPLEEILFDPQTSGGLLFAVPQEDGNAFLQELKEAGLPAQIVGRLIKQGDAGFQKEITVL